MARVPDGFRPAWLRALAVRRERRALIALGISTPEMPAQAIRDAVEAKPKAPVMCEGYWPRKAA